MFKEKFSANKVKPPKKANIFDVKQWEGELPKEYLNCFCTMSVHIQNLNEEIVIDAFVKGLQVNLFRVSLLLNRAKSMTKI